jgi:pyruvate, water dikinase
VGYNRDNRQDIIGGPAVRPPQDRRTLIYVSFVLHPASPSRFFTKEVDPRHDLQRPGKQDHRREGKEAFYVFDNLSALVADWATDELLANFFQ